MKHAVVQSGKYKGSDAVILGTDRDYLGKAIWAFREPFAFDYMNRVGTEGMSVLDKVLIANINGEIVALNENELKPKQEEKNVADAGKGTTKH